MKKKNLKIEVERSSKERTATVRCRGEIDAHTSRQLDRIMSRLLGQGTRYIITDMGHVSYLSCAGVGVLIGSKRRAEGYGGALVLLNLLPAVKEVLALLGFERTFTVA